MTPKMVELLLKLLKRDERRLAAAASAMKDGMEFGKRAAEKLELVRQTMACLEAK